MDSWSDVFKQIIENIATFCTIKLFVAPPNTTSTTNAVGQGEYPISSSSQAAKKPSGRKPTSVSHPITIPVKKPLSTIFRKEFLIIIAISVGVAVMYFLIDIVSARISSATPTPTITPSPPIATISYVGSSNSRLDEMEPILPRKNSFFIQRWNKFDEIMVDGVVFPHSIGVCIPKDDQIDYYEENLQTEQSHNEYIEYPLAFKYKTFQFEYGIDDTSFPEGIEEASLCQFMIIVQSCDSEQYLGSEDNILFKTCWFNYRHTIHRSKNIDVSNCEAIRITVHWKFYVRQDIPLAFNVAIINPILNALES